MKKVLFLGLLFCASFTSISQDLRVEPLNWWVGMKNPNLQLLIKGKDLSGGQVSSSKKGLTVKKVTNGDSPNYLFVDLIVEAGAQAGTYPLVIKKNGAVIQTVNYSLEARAKNSAIRPSYSTKDVIYLITPDRFANGNPANDKVAGMRDMSLNRGA
jgi:hypothetical protein